MFERRCVNVRNSILDQMSCSGGVFDCDLGDVENAISNGFGFRDDDAVAGIWTV